MRTNRSLALLLWLNFSALACAQIPARSSPATAHNKAQLAAQFHRSALVIDTHTGIAQRFFDEHFDLASPLGGGNLNLDSIHKGNLGAEFFSVGVDPALYQGQYARRTLELIDAVKQQVVKHPKELIFVATPGGIELAHRERMLAVLLSIDGGQSIEDSISLLRQFYALGVRSMSLTSATSNDWADSSGDINDRSVPHTKDGLTEFGKQVVYEMNRLGMMVDVSNASDRTFYKAITITRAPVIASHSSARALCDTPRNLSDDMLRAVARSGGANSKGGVVQVSFSSALLSQASRDAAKAQQPEIDKAVQALKDQAKAEGKSPSSTEIEKIQRRFADRISRPPLSTLIDQIDHVVKVAGIDHAGLASDFDAVSGRLPEGIDSAADLPKITEALLARGYTAEGCRKILGGNLMRVFREVEQVSRQLQTESRPKIGK